MRVGYYAANFPDAPAFAPLDGPIDAAVAIVGGGFAGLDTARSLLDRGVRDVVLLEAREIGFGASGRNGGFVFSGYSLGEEALLKRAGAARARRLHARSVAAVRHIRERVQRHAIDCGLVDAGVIWANWFADAEVLRHRQRILAEHYDVTWDWMPRESVREALASARYTDALFERNALHLDPLRYAVGLARSLAADGARVHEHSAARSIARDGHGWRVDTACGSVRARHLVLATGGYLAGLDRRIDRAVLPVATYVMVTEPLGARIGAAIRTRAAVYDTRFAFDYYRVLPDTRLLWGGRISILERDPRCIARLLRRDLAHVFPQLAQVRIEHAWSGLMSYARHQMPQVGGNGEGLWWAQAFGGHGLAPTTVAGEVLAEAIAGDDPGWRDFEPFGLVESFRPAGYLAAQASYWLAEARDTWKERSER